MKPKEGTTSQSQNQGCGHGEGEHSHSHSHSAPAAPKSAAPKAAAPKAKDPENPQWSTVVSDGVLAAVCFYEGRKLFDSGRYWAAIGVLLIGTAASCGTLKFGGLTQIRPLHIWLSAAVLTLLLCFFCFYSFRFAKIFLPLFFLCCETGSCSVSALDWLQHRQS